MSNTMEYNEIVNDIGVDEQKTDYQICSRCIMDSMVPRITFDQNGVCNFCKLQDSMSETFPNDERGDKILAASIEKIKQQGKKGAHDCIIGISGGRDSSYLLYLAKEVWGLRPLAVHFNDGFGNPVAGQNMLNVTNSLNVELQTITSDWRESKDIRIAFLKSSALNFGMSTDIGFTSALYGVAHKENIKHILTGNSFRTEGIVPLYWSYFDGYYLKKIHEKFGSTELRSWKPDDPGFNLDLHHMVYYSIFKGIRIFTPLYYHTYVRSTADEIISNQLGWTDPGAHYYDDLYQSLLFYLERVKYKMDRRKPNYSALVRSAQMSRDEALERIKKPYQIEDPKVINLCIKRLGLSKEEFSKYIDQPPKYFTEFPNRYKLLLMAKPAIKMLSLFNIIPKVSYDKYFNCG
jgi:N-acetyl sugar amidotransferase